MLLLWLILGLSAGTFLFRRNRRLEEAPAPAASPSVRASVDGKPVDCYIRE